MNKELINRILHILRIRDHQPDFSTFEVVDVHMNDYPDFCDAHWECGSWDDGTECSDTELDTLSDQHSDVLYEHAYDSSCGE